MILGCAGRIHSGKDSVGKALISQFGFKRVAFADGVRDKVIETYGFDREWVYSDAFKEAVVLIVSRSDSGSSPEELTGRQLLQREGMAARKVFGDDCWIKVAMAKCAFGPCGRCGKDKYDHIVRDLWYCTRGTSPDGPRPRYINSSNYVITDVRFPNEVAAIDAVGGRVIRLNRADRRDWHNFDGPLPALCAYLHYSAPDRVCNLPREAHPTHDSGDIHASETSLPDESNEWIKYDGVASGSMEENVQAAVELVKGWLVR